MNLFKKWCFVNSKVLSIALSVVLIGVIVVGLYPIFYKTSVSASSGYISIDIKRTATTNVGWNYSSLIDIDSIGDIPAYGALEPSGCGFFKGTVKLRIDLFVKSSGFNGIIPENWESNPFHTHFVYFDPEVTDGEIRTKIVETTEYFYAFYSYCFEIDSEFMDNWVAVPEVKGTIKDTFVEGDASPGDCILRIEDIISRTEDFDTRNLDKIPTSNQDLGIGDKGTIDVGDAATNQGGWWIPEYTFVAKGNPANDTGSITSVEVYAVSGQDLVNFEVALFDEVDTNTFTTRDNYTIGSVTGGSKQTFSGLDISVATGDYIGGYFTGGQLESASSGSAGV